MIQAFERLWQEWVRPRATIQQLRSELRLVRKINEGLANRVYAQSQLLSRRAERSRHQETSLLTCSLCGQKEMDGISLASAYDAHTGTAAECVEICRPCFWPVLAMLWDLIAEDVKRSLIARVRENRSATELRRNS